MILPTIRASFGRKDILHLVDIVAGEDVELRRLTRGRLDEHGADSVLDDPRVLNALLSARDVKAPPSLVFYVLVRHALLEGGIGSRDTADYVASMVLAFARSTRVHRVSEGSHEEYRYLVDMVAKIADAPPREAFMLRKHLGDFSLWLSGLYPDFIQRRVQRRGAPPIRYYEAMGASGYDMASASPEARALDLDDVLSEVSTHFAGVRVALNRVSDRYLHPHGNPVNRLLRELEAGG
jgi:hypothetical protein